MVHIIPLDHSAGADHLTGVPRRFDRNGSVANHVASGKPRIFTLRTRVALNSGDPHGAGTNADSVVAPFLQAGSWGEGAGKIQLIEILPLAPLPMG
jgi:hypothetical protein